MTVVDRDPAMPNGFVSGVAKKVDIDLFPVNPSVDFVARNVSVLLENLTPATQPAHLCCAAIGFSGLNYPCINHTGLGYTRTFVNDAT
jgi:hypothetical protein